MTLAGALSARWHLRSQVLAVRLHGKCPHGADFSVPQDWIAAYATFVREKAAALRPLGDSVRGCDLAAQPYEFRMLPLSADGTTVTGMISLEDCGALSLLERSRAGKVRPRQTRAQGGTRPPHARHIRSFVRAARGPTSDATSSPLKAPPALVVRYDTIALPVGVNSARPACPIKGGGDRGLCGTSHHRLFAWQ